MKIMRWIIALIFLAVAAFCSFGFLATFEPGAPSAMAFAEPDQRCHYPFRRLRAFHRHDEPSAAFRAAVGAVLPAEAHMGVSDTGDLRVADGGATEISAEAVDDVLTAAVRPGGAAADREENASAMVSKSAAMAAHGLNKAFLWSVWQEGSRMFRGYLVATSGRGLVRAGSDIQDRAQRERVVGAVDETQLAAPGGHLPGR